MPEFRQIVVRKCEELHFARAERSAASFRRFFVTSIAACEISRTLRNPKASDWAYSNLCRKRSKRRAHENEEGNASLRSGRQIPVINTKDGVRAVIKNQPIEAKSVERYLESKFGESLATARGDTRRSGMVSLRVLRFW